MKMKLNLISVVQYFMTLEILCIFLKLADI